MSTTQTEPKQSFDLSGLAELAEKAGVDIDATPTQEADDAAAEKEAADRAKFEAEAKGAPAAAEPAGGDPEPEPAPDPAAAEAEAAAKAEADAAKLAEDTKKAEEAAAAAQEAAKKADPTGTRDADLAKLDAEATVHMRPKQRASWDQLKEAAKKARDDAAAAAKEAAELKTQLEAAKAATSAVPIPKEVEEERNALRERVRELDAERDPEIAKKYDAPIKSTQDAIVGVLKAFGYDKRVDDKGNVIGENPAAITDLLARGLTYKNLQPAIDALRKLGNVDEARMLERGLDKIADLKENRAAEIQAIKGDIETRTKARTEQQTAAQRQMIEQVGAQANKLLAADLGELAKKHAALVKPVAPLPTDSPAIAAAKKAAIAEFEKVDAEIVKAVQAVSSFGKQGKEFVDAEAKKTALAIQSVVIKNRLVPRLEKDLADAQARIRQLESELGKVKGAGAISRAHGAAAQTSSKGMKIDASMSLEDAAREMAKAMGVSVNS